MRVWRRLVSNRSEVEARRVYREQSAERRRVWRTEAIGRRKAVEAAQLTERRRIVAEKTERRQKRQATAKDSKERQAQLQREAEEKHRVKIDASILLAAEREAARVDRQERLVDALEDESALWLTSDAKIDEKINDSLWIKPASTGLLTDESHVFWRYVADVDRHTYNPPDFSTILPTSRDRERARVATMTERLIRTQSKDMAEYHDALKSAADLSEVIKDLDVNYVKARKRPTTTTTKPSS